MQHYFYIEKNNNLEKMFSEASFFSFSTMAEIVHKKNFRKFQAFQKKKKREKKLFCPFSNLFPIMG